MRLSPGVESCGHSYYYDIGKLSLHKNKKQNKTKQQQQQQKQQLIDFTFFCKTSIWLYKLLNAIQMTNYRQGQAKFSLNTHYCNIAFDPW